MKKTALLAAAAAMMSATPALAEVGGYVGLEFTETDLHQFITPEELEADRGEFALGFAGERWGAQVEGGYGNTEFTFLDIDITTFAAHLWYAGDNWRLGGVVTHTKFQFFDMTEWAYGVEGTYDVTPNLVLSASYTKGEFDDFGDELTDLDLAANYYVTPNLRVRAMAGVGTYDYGPSRDTETYGLSAEYQPFSAPVSLTLGWSSYDVDQELSSESVSFGVRWNFGAATLRERDELTPFSAAMGFNARANGAN